MAARCAWVLWALLVVAWTATRLLIEPAPDAPPDSSVWHVAFLTYGAMGALIVSRRPDNHVGWLFLVVGTFDPVAAAVRMVAATAGTGAFADSTVNVADWLQSWLWAPSMGGLILLIYVFPDGRFPPGRWRWGAVATIAATAALLILNPFLAWPYRGLILDSRVPATTLASIVPAASFAVMLVCLGAGVVWVGRRFRRSGGTERMQLKWFFYGIAVLVAAAFTDIFILEALQAAEGSLVRQAMYWPFVLPPISAAIAVLRHRLYDIDRIINRTVVYTVLTMFLAAAYLAAVTAMRLATAQLTGDTAVAVAASTLAVAAMFQPARRRIQQVVDHRFNRARYDAAATIAAFSGRLRDEVDIDTLSAELVGVVSATMQPARTTLWLQEAER